MLFACICWDKPHMGEARERVFHDHLAHLKSKGEVVRIGGPLLDGDGAMIGTLLVIDVEGEASAQVFMDEEVFNRNGIFETVKIRRWRQYQPEPRPGDGDLADEAAKLRVRQDGV